MTITQCYEEVGLLLLFLSVGISIFSTVEYFAEQSIPDTTFTSVPCAWWWATTSMTTVGYGDIRPDTTTGKIVAFMCILSGILVLALPIAIINDRFSACYFTLKLKEAAVRQREALKKLTKNIATDSYISVNLRDVYARSIMEMLRLKGRERASTRSSGGDDFWFWIHFQFTYKTCVILTWLIKPWYGCLYTAAESILSPACVHFSWLIAWSSRIVHIPPKQQHIVLIHLSLKNSI